MCGAMACRMVGGVDVILIKYVILLSFCIFQLLVNYFTDYSKILLIFISFKQGDFGENEFA